MDKPVAGYWRVSRDEPGKESPGDYERAIKRWAEEHGHRIGAIFGDLDVSGKAGTRRPQQEEMLDRLHEFSVVVVPRLDRLSRNMVEAIGIIDVILDAELDFIALDVPGLDTTTPYGGFIRDMLLRIGQLYLDQISAQWEAIFERLALQGRYQGGGATPFGYVFVSKPEAERTGQQPGLFPDPKTRGVVVEIFERYRAGESMHSIADDLEARDVPTRSGGKWNHSTIKAILENPVYAGVLRRHKYKTVKDRDPTTGRTKDRKVRTGEYQDFPGKWEPLVPKDLWEQVKTLRTAHRDEAKASGAKNMNRGQYLLTGLLYCGECGSRMHHKTKLYVCPNKNCTDGGIGDSRADHLVYVAFAKFLTNPTVLANINRRPTKPKRTNFEKALEDLDKQMDRLVELSLSASGPVAQKSFERKSGEIEAKRERLIRERTAAEADDVVEEVKVKSGLAFVNDLAKLDIDLTTLSDESPEEHLRAVEGVLTFHEQGRIGQARQLLELAIHEIRTVPGTRPKDLEIHWAAWTKRKPKRVSAPIKRRWQKRPA